MKRLVWAVSVLALFAITGPAWAEDEAALPPLAMPKEQKELNDLLIKVATDKMTVANSVQKAALDRKLATAMAAPKFSHPKNWVGTIVDFDVNENKDAWVEINLGQLWIGSERFDLEHIPKTGTFQPGSSVFNALTKMKTGDRVRFSATELEVGWKVVDFPYNARVFGRITKIEPYR